MTFMAKPYVLLQMSYHITVPKPGPQFMVGGPYRVTSIAYSTHEKDEIFSVMESLYPLLVDRFSRRTLFCMALYSRVLRHW